MGESVFDTSFDIDQYVQKRLLEIDNLEERQILKKVVSQIFLDLHGHIENEYLALEHRVFGETNQTNTQVTITTGLIERELYDVTDNFFSPMRESDLEENKIELAQLIEHLKVQKSFYVYTMFLEADYLLNHELAQSKRTFKGVIKTAYGEYKGLFQVRPNTYYTHLIENLYVIFNLNYLSWQTICAPYIHKLFDVYLCSIEEWDAYEEIESIEIDFEEYQKYVRYDCVPLWNVSTTQIKSSTYPEACIDKINYEHIIYGKKLAPQADYLIGNTETHITNIRKIAGDVMITCEESTPKLWFLYKISQQKMTPGHYPAMNNRINDDFSTYLFDKYKNCIKTKTEVARLINALGYSEYIIFKDLVISQAHQGIIETYDMDHFIADEIRIHDSNGPRLTLMFEAIQRDYYLNRDIMSYIVTYIQKYFPEYLCEGKLV